MISTPHGLHAEHARAALTEGRHVLLDKPFALRSAEAAALSELAAARGLVAAVAFNRRFDPGCRRARERRGGAAPWARSPWSRPSSWATRPPAGSTTRRSAAAAPSSAGAPTWRT